jgi:hypothetical protein
MPSRFSYFRASLVGLARWKLKDTLCVPLTHSKQSLRSGLDWEKKVSRTRQKAHWPHARALLLTLNTEL